MKKLGNLRKWAFLLAAMPASLLAQTVNIDLGKERQLIRGFGGINFPGWIQDLSESQRATAFGNGENQLGLSVLRIHVDPNESAWKNEVATAQYAAKQGAYIFASPWSPPSDMAEKFTRNGKGNQTRVKASSYAAYAQHLNKFVSYMKENGVELYGISVQNEPDYAEDWTWWTPSEMVTFLRNNASSINCRIIAPESFQYTKSTSDPILNDAQAWANVDILGTHLYGTQVSAFQYPLFESKRGNRELWMTEVYYPNSSSDADTWPEALEVADHIGNAMVVGNFQAYVWWYIRRSYSFIKDNGNITKRGYCMAQFSKFVRPGFVRVDATQHPGNDNNLNISAYKKENDVVIVAVNRNNSSKTLTISIPNSEIKEWERYVTDQTRNVKKESNVEGSTSFQLTLDAKSAVTLVGKGKKGMPKVTITAPTSTDDIEAGADIGFTAEATDENGSIQSVKFYDGNTLLGETTDAPYTYEVKNLSLGDHTLKAVATDNEGNESSASVTIKVHEPQTPYGGTAQTIPGRIEAENYDNGGNGYAYYDSDEGNKGETYRNDDVDIDATSDGGYAIGWTINGEWLEYTVDVEETDIYEWTARVSCSNDNSAFHLYIDGKEITESVKVPNYEDWTTYNPLKGTTNIPIEKGRHILRIEVDGSYFNIDYIEFASKTTGVNALSALSARQGDYKAFSLDGKEIGVFSIKDGTEAATELKKRGVAKGTYILTSETETFKVEISD